MSVKITAHFIQDRVMFIDGKRTFCTSGHKWRNGKKAERVEYKLDKKVFEELEAKGIVERKHKKKAKKNG